MKNEQKFNLDEICQNSKELLGVYPEVIYGALFLRDKQEEYSLGEVKEAINEFLSKEVK